MPPLRERQDDIEVIVERTLTDLTAQGAVSRIRKKDWAQLNTYSWPGNVRQLIKLVRRAVFLDMSVGEALAEERSLGNLTPDQGGDRSASSPIWPMSTEEVLPMERVKRIYAQRTLELFQGNHAATRRALGIAHHNSLHKLVQDQK